MILHEIKRMLAWRPVAVMLCLVVPLLLLATFVPGIKSPSPAPTDSTVIDAHLASLPSIFERLKDTTVITTNQRLLNTWIVFGGQTDDYTGDIRGAYYNFYRAEVNDAFQMRHTFSIAKIAFMDFYELYQDFMTPMPTVFIRRSDYANLSWGVEQLYNRFNSVDGATSPIQEINDARFAMNKVRQRVPFRQILMGARDMILTQEQINDLNAILEKMNQRRNELRQGDPAYYVDYSIMTYEYISWHQRRYTEQNAGFSTRSFQGFTTSVKEAEKFEMTRLRWLVNNDKFNLDYSYPPGGLSHKRTFSLMHKTTGTSIIDFIFNATEIIWPALAILLVLMTVFCIFDDIKNKTILGAIASRYTRREIIWSKLLACLLCMTILLLFFCIMFLVLGSIVLNGLPMPPTVVVFAFGYALSMASGGFLFLHLIGLLFKSFLIISLTALISIIVANLTKQIQDPIKYRAAMYAPACFFAIAIVLMDVFLKIFSAYTIVFYPAAIFIMICMLVRIDQRFTRKEFL